MRKSLLSILLTFSLIVVSFNAEAQCPTVAATTINTCDFSTGGEITFIFSDGGSSEQNNYILFDTNGPTAVSAPFGSVTKSYNAATQTLVFGNIPDGTYLAANSADGCPALGGAGISINQTNELILSVNTITPDCDNLGSGAIDLNTTGGDAPYTYTWTPVLPDQEDQTGLFSGSYDVTVTDSDNCSFTLNSIVVPAGPNAGVYTGTPAEVCSDNTGFDLTSLLDGSQDAGGTWADTDASGAVITGNNADFSGIAAGAYDFTYTVAGAGGCADDSEVVTVNVTAAANAGVYTGTPAEVCTTDAAFDLTSLLDGSQDAGGTWADTDASGAVITGNNADFNGVTAGTYNFTYTVTGAGPCGDDSEVVTVNVNEAPNAGVYTGTPAEVCSDNTGFDLTSLLDGSQDAGGTWADTDASGAVITGNNADFSGIAAGAYDFTYTVAGAGGCVDDSEVVTVNVTAAANAGVYTGTPAEVCTTDAAFDLTSLLDGSQDAGGTWADTDASGAVITGNNADFNGVTAGTYNFTYTVTGAGPCGDDSEVVTVNVNEAPNAGVYTGTPAEVCSDNTGFDLTSLLDGSQDAGGTWADTDASGAVITGNNADFSGIAAGAYDFTYTVAGAGGCADDSEVVTVNVTAAANAGVYTGTPAEVCTTDAAFDLTSLLDGSQDAGGTWADTDASGAVITGNNADFNGVTAGTYNFTYTVTGAGPCGDDSEVVTVNVNEAPNAGVYTGTPAEVCSDNTGFDLTSLLDGSQDAGGTWADTDASGAVITGNNADFSGIAAGAYDFTYTVAGAGGCADDSEVVTVNVTAAANAGVYTGTPAEVCTTDAAFDLTSLLDGSQDAGGTWADTDASGAVITGNNADFNGVTAGTYNFTYTVTGAGPCGDDSEVVTVNVNEAPNAGVYTGTPAEVCSDNTGFDLTSLLDGSQDAGGTWADTDASGAVITGNNADFSGIAAGAYDFTYTVAGAGGCVDDSEVVTVNVTAAANAGVYTGTPAEVCTTDAAFDLTSLLDGSQDAGGTWADTDASGAVITGNNADFNGVTAGTYNFTYTVTGAGPCGDDSEVVTVNVNEAPNAGIYTGTPAEVCSDNTGFDLTSLLDGSQDAGGTWADTDASGAVITGNNADFSGIVAGAYDFTYTVAGAGGCADDSEVVTVNVTAAANAGVYTGTPAEVCTTDAAFDLTSLLDGSQDAGGTWADTDASGAVITGNNADFNGVTAGTYNFTYTVTGAGPCGDDSEVVTVNVNEAPNAGVYTGTPAEVCSDNTGFDLTSLLDGSQDAGGTWADTDASGAVITGNNADFSGIVAGAYDFTYTVAGAGGCADDSEVVTVNVTAAANAGVYTGTPAEVCTTDAAFDLTSLLDGSQDAGGTWADTDASGAVITGNNADFNGVTAGTYNFTYTVTGAGPCGDDSEVVTVNVNEAPNAGIYTGTPAEVCSDNTGFDLTSLLDGSQDAGGTWADTDASGAVITGNNADFSGIVAGAYDFTYTVAGAGGCVDDSEVVTVNVTAAANAGVYTGTPVEVCTTDAAFDLTSLLDGSQDAGGTWADTDASGAVITGNNADFNGVTAGTYNFTYTVTGAGPCGDDSEVVTVNVNEAPNAGVYTGTPAEVCSDNTGFDLTSLLDGSQDAGGTWADTDASGAVITGNNADFSGIVAGAYDFTYTVAGAGGCVDDSEVVTVNVTAAANAGVYTGTPVEVCTTDAAFDLTSLLDGSQDAGGTWADTDASGAVITGNNADFNGVTAGTYNFTYTVTGAGPCGDDSEVVTVNVNEAPNAGVYTGTPAEVCSDNTGFDLTSLLDGSQDAGGTWADTDASGAVITGNNADFSGIAAGAYDFTYTVAGAGGCADDSEVVTVNVTAAANAGVYTGTPAEVCTTDAAFDLTSLLDGSQDAGGTWADTDASGAVITGNNADFNGVTAGTYNFTYTVTGAGPCGDDSEVVTVNVNEAPNAGIYTGTPAEVCSDNTGFDLTSLLDGSQDAGGTWADTDASGAVITGNNADFSGIAAGAYDFTYTVAGAGGCADDSEVVTVNVTAAANAGVYTGTPAEVCTTDAAFDLTSLLDGSQDAGGTWADTDASGAVITGNNADFNGVTAGTYNFTYTVTGAGPCGDDSEVVTVNVNEAPNAGVYTGTPAEVCSDNTGFDLTSLLDGSQDAGGTWADTDASGAVITGNNADFSGIAAGAYDFTYTVAGAGGCVDDSEVVTVNINSLSLSASTTNTTGCGVADGAIDLSVTSSFTGDTFTFAWTGPNSFTATTEDISGLEGGNYTVSVTSDNTGCVVSDTYIIIDPVPFTLDNFTVTDQSQCGIDNGAVGFDVVSGTGPYNYYIVDTNTNTEVAGSRSDNDASASYSFASLAPGDYEVFVEDGPCTQGTIFTVAPVNQITASISNFTDATCGSADGTIELSITDVGNDYEVIVDDGVNTPSTNAVSAGTTTFTITGLALGNYDITVRDVITLCEVSFSQAIAENASFTVDNATVTDIQTCGGSEGEILLDISGLVTPTTYSWTGPNGFTASTEDITGLTDAGTYEVTIVDNGCTVIRSYDIISPVPPFAGDYVGTAGTATLANNPYDLFSLLTNSPDAGGVWTLTNSANGGGTDPTFDTNTGEVDFASASSGTYTFRYTVTGIPSCTDSEDVIVEFLSFSCADSKFSILTESATCSGVQDGLVFLFLTAVSNSDSLSAVINGTDTLTFANTGNGTLVELDTTFFSGNYDITLYDDVNGCSNTRNITIGQKQSIIPSIDKTDPTCDNPEGQIQVTLSGTFDFVLLNSTDAEITRNTSGVFNSLTPGTYGIAFENTGSQICQVDTVRNIVINTPTAVSNSALDVTVVEPGCNTNNAQVIVNFDLTGSFFYQITDTAGAVVDSVTTSTGSVTFDLDTLGTFDLSVSNVDNPGLCEPNAETFSIQRSGGFTAVASDVQNIVCFGESTGSVIITLDGISTAFYSVDNGNLWNEFTSGNTITGLPAINNMLVSDQPGTSTCELSVPVNIQFDSQPIELNGTIELVTQASCTTAEEIGEIRVPEVTGGVSPYSYFIDATEVTLTADRIISGLARNVSNLIVVDNTGCSETFAIGSIVSPNEVRAIVEEINPNENCLDQPEGLRITIDQNTIDNVSGPYNFIINEVNDAVTTEFTLDVNVSGSNVFVIGPDEDLTFDFIKGVRYRWTLRSVTNEQACSADNFITIQAGAIIPSFTIEGVDAQCFGQSGAIELSDIEGDEDLPLTIKLFNDRDDLIDQFDLASIPFSGSFIIDENNYGKVDAGIYNVILQQDPAGCTDSVVSSYQQAVVDAPSGELLAKLVDEPFRVTPELSRTEMNPVPTSRPDRADGSISIELISKSSSTSYSAQIFEVRALPGSGITLQEMRDQLPSGPVEFGTNDMITFSNLYPGIYSVEYFDAFGCGTSGNKLIAGKDGTFEIIVGFDETPFIPNVFTPDGDGVNDEFEILNLSDTGNEMIITNRTGAIVYDNKNYRPADLWDGGDQPDGVYFYQLTTEDNSVFSGWIEIVRDRNNK